jgi:hypothetical protein
MIDYIHLINNISHDIYIIAKNSDRVNWRYILKYQDVSEDFVLRNADKIYWNDLI